MIIRTIVVYFVFAVNVVIAQPIKIGTVFINHTLPINGSIDALSQFVKIDSITKVPGIMDMSEADSLVYVGKSYFEYFKGSRKCALSVLIFDDKISDLSIGSNSFSAETTETDLQKVYPSFCSTMKPIDIFGDSANYKSCSISLVDAQENALDAQLIFFFSGGKLNRVDFWEES